MGIFFAQKGLLLKILVFIIIINYNMKMDVNNNTFLSFLDNTTNNILTKINIKNYFVLNEGQKLTLSYTVFNILKTTTNLTLIDNDFKMFIGYLRKKNENEENYEFASILNDIIRNFDRIIEMNNEKKGEIKKKTPENN